MPLFLVRCANLSAAFVNARDENHLVDILDEVGDPSGAKWHVYRGPQHIELDVPFEIQVTGKGGRARSLADVSVTNCPEELELDAVTFGAANSDTGSEMLDAIWKFAFPNLFRAFTGNDWSLSRDEAKKAATKDLDVLVQALWQMDHLGRSPDPDAALATMAGTSLRQIKNVLQKPRSGSRAPVRPLTPDAGKKRGRARKKQKRR
jgi:hypothetical protein